MWGGTKFNHGCAGWSHAEIHRATLEMKVTLAYFPFPSWFVVLWLKSELKYSEALTERAERLAAPGEEVLTCCRGHRLGLSAPAKANRSSMPFLIVTLTREAIISESVCHSSSSPSQQGHPWRNPLLQTCSPPSLLPQDGLVPSHREVKALLDPAASGPTFLGAPIFCRPMGNGERQAAWNPWGWI